MHSNPLDRHSARPSGFDRRSPYHPLPRRAGKDVAFCRHGEARRRVGRRWLIGRVDSVLRRLYGIREFESEDRGMLRIAVGRAEHMLTLADGTRIERDDAVIDLHIWNEHFPSRPRDIRDLGWAVRVQRQALATFHRLALHLQTNRALDRVRALRMTPAFMHRKGEDPPALLSMGGFEWVPAAGSRPSLPLAALDNLWAWLLTWTYNPAALKGWRFARSRPEFWISRSRFLELYEAPKLSRRPRPDSTMRRACHRPLPN